MALKCWVSSDALFWRQLCIFPPDAKGSVHLSLSPTRFLVVRKHTIPQLLATHDHGDSNRWRREAYSMSLTAIASLPAKESCLLGVRLPRRILFPKRFVASSCNDLPFLPFLPYVVASSLSSALFGAVWLLGWLERLNRCLILAAQQDLCSLGRRGDWCRFWVVCVLWCSSWAENLPLDSSHSLSHTRIHFE